MKKQFLNLGKALNKAEQKQIKGGYSKLYCYYHSTRISVLGLVIHDDHMDYEACRAM